MNTMTANAIALAGRWRAIDQFGNSFMIDLSTRLTIIQNVSPDHFRPVLMIGNDEPKQWPSVQIGSTLSVFDPEHPFLTVFIAPQSRDMFVLSFGGMVMFAWRTITGHEQARFFAHTIRDDFGTHMWVNPQWN